MTWLFWEVQLIWVCSDPNLWWLKIWDNTNLNDLNPNHMRPRQSYLEWFETQNSNDLNLRWSGPNKSVLTQFWSEQNYIPVYNLLLIHVIGNNSTENKNKDISIDILLQKGACETFPLPKYAWSNVTKHTYSTWPTND